MKPVDDFCTLLSEITWLTTSLLFHFIWLEDVKWNSVSDSSDELALKAKLRLFSWRVMSRKGKRLQKFINIMVISQATSEHEQPPNYLETAKQWGKVTNTMYSWQKSTTCRNGMQVLWCHYYVVWWFLRVPSLLALVFIHKLCYDFSHSSYLCHTIKLIINFYSISFIAQMTLLSLRNFFIPKLVLLLLL